MIDFKQIIAKNISDVISIPEEEIVSYIEIPKDTSNGDYAFPCFRLAKILKKAPQIIASDIKERVILDEKNITKVEIAGGYLNFFVNKDTKIKTVLNEIANNDEYGKSEYGKGKNIIVEFSSPNIAKPFHIGHLRTTILGNSLYKMYKFLNYNCVGINHLGDWGTQFAKLIEGYKRWGTEYDIENNPIEELTKIYIRINDLCKEDESVLEQCRDNFKKLEDGDEYCVKIWQKFRELSLKEFQRIYDLLDIQFDSWNGEAFYTDKMQEVKDILEKNNKLVESEGARVVDLSKEDMPPCIIEKSNGSTTYATRDLAAILYRARTYNFDKALYVTSYEQILHFKQVFETAKYLDLDEKYTNGLVHVPYGMVMLKTGKMSTRDGNVVKIEDLLKEAIAKVKIIIENKNPELENKEDIATKVGIGAVIFNDLYNSRIKDEIFDWDIMLNFNGETGPYMQYIYVRTKSVLEKVGYIPKLKDVNLDKLLDEDSVKVIKLLYQFNDKIMQAIEKYEPYIVARYLIEVAKTYSSFYNNNKIICDDKEVQDARIYLTYATGIVLKTGAALLGIKMPDKM